MRIAAHRGTRLHAPENSIAAFVSSYAAGADVLEFDVQLTSDGALVVAHDGDTKRLTGHDGKIIDQSLADLKKLDWSETFLPRNSPGFQYFTDPKRMLAPVTFPAVLDALPEDVELLLELKHDSSETTGRREKFVRTALEGLKLHSAVARTVVYSKDPANLLLARTIEPTLRVAAFDFNKSPAEQLELLKTTRADGLVTDLDSVLVTGQLSDFGQKLKDFCAEKKLKVGAVLYPFRTPGVFSQAEFDALRTHDFIWSISTDSALEVSFVRPAGPRLGTQFAGEEVDRENFALGYAKANKYINVFQDDGVHVDITEYDRPFPPPSADPLTRKVEGLDNKLLFAAKDWPYYSGGGVGMVLGIRGDFSAEVDYTVERSRAGDDAGDGGAQRRSRRALGAARRRRSAIRTRSTIRTARRPTSGVEHDEDDGYRINWNLGSEYDNNQYGRAGGRRARRRAPRDFASSVAAPYFAAYYRNAVRRPGLGCAGSAWRRNDTLNPVVYLRCVGKRWRQEDGTTPS